MSLYKYALAGERGTMIRAQSFVNVAASREISNPAWCRIFREIFLSFQYWDIVSMFCS